MTLAAPQCLGELGDVQTGGFFVTGYVHSPVSSAIPNYLSTEKFGISVTTLPILRRRLRFMGKKNKKVKRRPDGGPLWYASEWLTHLGKRQVDIVAATDYTKSQVSEWVNCTERFNADVLHGFAWALGIEASDLLRPPSSHTDNELARYVMRLDAQQRDRALKVLRAADILPAGDKAA